MLPRASQISLDSGEGWKLLPRAPNDSLNAVDDSDAAAIKPSTTPSNDASDAITQSDNTPGSLSDLPPEVLERIIAFVCGLPGDSAFAPCVDAKATADLALVSYQLYQYALPLLYTCVTLGKPSQLMLYTRTILEYPELAAMTKALWIGPHPDTLLSPLWWPVNRSRDAMRSSLTDPAMLPRGVAVGTWWPIVVRHQEGDSCGLQSCAEAAAVAEVLKYAWLRVNATIEGPECCKDGPIEHRECLPKREWRRNAFRVQHVLDGYLKAWRKCQDAALWQEYILNDVEPICSPTERSCDYDGNLPDPYIWVLRDCNHRLSIDYAECDFFDHPVFYEDANAGEYAFEENEGEVDGKFLLGFRLYKKLFEASGTSRVFRWLLPYSSKIRPPIDCLLKACETVLVHSPHLIGLALTGYARAVLFHKLPIRQGRDLRLLSLGPTPQFIHWSIADDQEYLSQVQVMHCHEYDLHNDTFYEVADACPKLQTISCHFWRLPIKSFGSAEPSAGYYNIISDIRALLVETQAVRILLASSADLVAHFKKYHGGLQDDPRLEVHETQGSIRGDDFVPYSLYFLDDDTYRAKAFSFMQREWREEVTKMLRNDTCFSRPYVFSGKKEDAP